MLAMSNRQFVDDFVNAEADAYQMVQGATKCDCPLYKNANDDLEQHAYHDFHCFVCLQDYY